MSQPTGSLSWSHSKPLKAFFNPVPKDNIQYVNSLDYAVFGTVEFQCNDCLLKTSLQTLQIALVESVKSSMHNFYLVRSSFYALGQ